MMKVLGRSLSKEILEDTPISKEKKIEISSQGLYIIYVKAL